MSELKPMDTAPKGECALKPHIIEVHEGSWAIVLGTNGNPAGWIDTNELFAHQLYTDQIIPRATLSPTPELVRYGVVTLEGGATTTPEINGEYVRYDQAASMIAAKDAEIARLDAYNKEWFKDFERVSERAEAAEAKLAALKNREPVGWFHFCPSSGEYTAEWCSVKPEDSSGSHPLYAAPVPAVDHEAEIIERCAKVAEIPIEDDDNLDRQVRLQVAAQIRALSGKETA